MTYKLVTRTALGVIKAARRSSHIARRPSTISPPTSGGSATYNVPNTLSLDGKVHSTWAVSGGDLAHSESVGSSPIIYNGDFGVIGGTTRVLTIIAYIGNAFGGIACIVRYTFGGPGWNGTWTLSSVLSTTPISGNPGGFTADFTGSTVTVTGVT